MTTPRGRRILIATFAAALGCTRTSVAPVSLASSTRVGPGEWPSYNRTLARDRFSPLDQIDRSNVTALQQICTYTLPEVAALQAGPIVIGGAMYFSTDTVTYADAPVLGAELDFTISENPNFRFYFVPHAAGELTARVVDTDNASFEASLAVAT